MTESSQPAEPVTERTSCRIHVEGFDGPLELLLNLVKERQFDIMTVPLASVAEQYLAFVSDMEHLDIDSAAEYLVIASTLAFLKSRSLLPPLPVELQEEDEQSPEEVEERLRRRLIAYSKFREIATILRDQADDASGFYRRTGGDPTAELHQRYLIDTQRLARALERALSQVKPERRTIMRERFSLVLQMQYVKRRLGDAPRLSFFALVSEYDRQGIIVTFLAVLELVRQRQLAVSQEAFDEELFVMPYEEVVELSVN